MSADVDLFAEASGEFDFAEAVDAVIKAYQREGLEVQTEVLAASLLRIAPRICQNSRCKTGTTPCVPQPRVYPLMGRSRRWLLAGSHGVDPGPDAVDDGGVGGKCLGSFGEGAKVDESGSDEGDGEVEVLLSKRTSLAKMQSCGSRQRPRPGSVPGVSETTRRSRQPAGNTPALTLTPCG